MTKADILHVLLYSLPEALAVVSLATILAGSRFIWKRLFIIGSITGFLSHFWRLLLTDYILNIACYAVILISFMTFYKIGTDLFARTTSVMIALSIYLTIEFINLKIYDVVIGLDPATMLTKPFLRYICFGGQISLIFLISYLLKYFKFSLFNRGCHEEV
ncbi:MAG: hypothetical protein ACOYVD_04250 [Bacillota bacterium]